MRKFSNKIFDLEPSRALEVMNILSMLEEIGRLSFKDAEKQGVTNDEWVKTQHFFLSISAKYKDEIVGELMRRL